MGKRTVFVFEDIGKEREKLKQAFKQAFNGKANIKFFEPESINTNSKKQETYEDQIIDYFKREKININDIALIITDRDLSTYKEWGGLSESVVSNVANKFAIPICLYAREDDKYATKDRILKAKKWSDYKIILDIGKDPSKFASECKIIFDGFEEIRKKFREKSKEKKTKSPAEMMVFILNKAALQDRIALYGAGDQHIAEDLFPYADDIKRMEKRIPRLLGYWLWDSILRYPGIMVYGKAAASYLNIDPDDFAKPNVAKLFQKALYKGPFSEIKNYWWRDGIDDILYKEKCRDGYELAKKNKLKVSECKCSVDKKIKAGYYCMITEEPISEQNSKSNISWFPSGADLARISLPKYEKYAPWIGLY